MVSKVVCASVTITVAVDLLVMSSKLVDTVVVSVVVKRCDTISGV